MVELDDEQLSLELLGPNARAQVPGNRLDPETGLELRGLPAHDDRRLGHTITKHVGQTDAQLLNRMQNNPPPEAVSSYTNLAVADRTVGRMIADNQNTIQLWLRDVDGDATLDLSYRGEAVTGRRVARDSSTISDVYGAVVVLVRSHSGPGAELGYFIATSYPVP